MVLSLKHHQFTDFIVPVWCFSCFVCLVFLLEHGQKFPGLRPADAAGLDGPQQKWAETGPGRASAEARADRIQPRAPEEC